MIPAPLTVSFQLRPKQLRRRVKVTAPTIAPVPCEMPAEFETPDAGRIPRIARLMALAIKLDGLVRAGKIKDYTELARLGHVTTTRASQIMNLTLLAPDIQEALLFLPPLTKGRDPWKEKIVFRIAGEPLWRRQREMWEKIVSE